MDITQRGLGENMLDTLIHQAVVNNFNPNMSYELQYPNSRRSSAVEMDVDLLTRSQVGGSCYLFVVVLMIYTSHLRYILKKRLEFVQYLSDTYPEQMNDISSVGQLECLKWIGNITTDSEVCENTCPDHLVSVYISAINRINEMHFQGDAWRPFNVLALFTNVGGQNDIMLFSVLNACGVRVPEVNYVALVLKNIPDVANVYHDYTVRKSGGSMYSTMTMPDIVKETTHSVSSSLASEGAFEGVLISPFIATFHTSNAPNEVYDRGLLVDINTATERFTTVLDSVMLYIELFKQKYKGSEIQHTHFSMVVRVRSGINGELIPDDVTHAVLVHMDDDRRVLVFDGNSGNSQPLEMWYPSFSLKYIEIHEISFALIPVIDPI